MSASSSNSSTVEFTVSDEEFDAYLRLLSLQRRNTHPANMARDSGSQYSQPRRSSSYSVANSPTSRSKSSGYYESVRSSTMSSGYAQSSTTNPSSYASTNVTGHRRCLDVQGLPDSKWFSTGASKYDRKPEYIGGQSSNSGGPTESCPPGNELVRYRSRPDDRDEGSDFDDKGTVLPQDSVSQVSSNRSAHEGKPVYDQSAGYNKIERRPRGH